MRKAVLITGCSEGGAGNAMAKEYHARGLKVFATARRLESMNNLLSLPGITFIQLDVTVISSIKNARDKVQGELTRSHSVKGNNEDRAAALDLLINNAGIAVVRPALDHDISSTRALFETNVFGLMNMVQTFTPLLMNSGDGCIVNIGSLGGILPWAFASSYNATKAAVHAYSDALRLELRPLNIKVITAIMGGVRTNLPNYKPEPLPSNSYYTSIEATFRKSSHGEYDHRTPLDEFARHFVLETLKANPPRHIMVGASSAFMSWVNWLLPGS